MTVSSPTGPESLRDVYPCKNQTATLHNISVNWQSAKINCKQLQYNMIYLLTATGLSPGGSSTVHIYIQTINRTTQITTEKHK
jgi:uncharacterized integral membrane protein